MNINIVLESILNEVNRKYDLSKNDRRLLASLEWDSTEGFSFLGEIEIWSDLIFGITNAFMKNNSEIAIDNINLLEKNSIFDFEKVSKWLRVEGQKYKEYIQYVMVVENLRFVVLILMKTINRD